MVTHALEERRTPGNTLIVQPDQPWQVRQPSLQGNCNCTYGGRCMFLVSSLHMQSLKATGAECMNSSVAQVLLTSLKLFRDGKPGTGYKHLKLDFVMVSTALSQAPGLLQSASRKIAAAQIRRSLMKRPTFALRRHQDPISSQVL